MLSKMTVIGIGAGIAISSIGIFALITSIGIQDFSIDETVEVRDFSNFEFRATQGTDQHLIIRGNSFHVTLDTPSDGLKIPGLDFKTHLDIQFIVLDEGDVRIEIKNTGDSPLELKGTIRALNDPILFTYHLLVITSGVIIIGFSAAFSVRKPRGF